MTTRSGWSMQTVIPRSEFLLYHVCTGVYACMCTCIWMAEDDLQCHFSGASTFFFLFETGSLIVLGIAKQTRIAGQQAQGSSHL